MKKYEKMENSKNGKNKYFLILLGLGALAMALMVMCLVVYGVEEKYFVKGVPETKLFDTREGRRVCSRAGTISALKCLQANIARAKVYSTLTTPRILPDVKTRCQDQGYSCNPAATCKASNYSSANPLISFTKYECKCNQQRGFYDKKGKHYCMPEYAWMAVCRTSTSQCDLTSKRHTSIDIHVKNVTTTTKSTTTEFETGIVCVTTQETTTSEVDNKDTTTSFDTATSFGSQTAVTAEGSTTVSMTHPTPSVTATTCSWATTTGTTDMVRSAVNTLAQYGILSIELSDFIEKIEIRDEQSAFNLIQSDKHR